MKTYTTEQVWKLLNKHPTWTFEAPKTNSWTQLSAHHDSHNGCVRIWWDTCVGTQEVVSRTDPMYRRCFRSDWARTNKPKPIRLTKFSNVKSVMLCMCDVEKMHPALTQQSETMTIDPSKTYKVLLVECD
jgi:hypothetical protein